MPPSKRCPACTHEKPIDQFGANAARADGHESYCRPCRNLRAKSYTAANIAKHRSAEPKPTAPEPSAPDELLTAALTAAHEARQRRDLAAESKALTAEVERLRAEQAAMRPLHGSTPIAIPTPPAHVKGEAVPLILASDWHVEEEVELEKMHGLNEYNLTIAEARARRFFVNSLRLVELTARDSVIRRVCVGLIGDLISNSIHPELMEINQLGPQPAARFAKDLIVGGLNYWLKNSDLEFEINCVGGNHGRMTEKTRIATNAENSLETFAYWFLAAEFKHEPRIKFRIAPGDMLYSQIFPGYRVRFIHGDQISYGGGVGGLTIPLNKWIARQDNSIRADLTVLGHFHQMIDGGRFMVNGSMIGPSPYSQRFGFSPEPPAQQFALIHSRAGGCKSIVAPVWLDIKDGT